MPILQTSFGGYLHFMFIAKKHLENELMKQK